MKVEPYCKNCGGMGHYDSQCTVQPLKVKGPSRQRVTVPSPSQSIVTKHCPTCTC